MKPIYDFFPESNLSAVLQKRNIESSCAVTKYGNKTCEINIFCDICKTIKFFPNFFLTLTILHKFP